jgi:hypothetical protein
MAKYKDNKWLRNILVLHSFWWITRNTYLCSLQSLILAGMCLFPIDKDRNSWLCSLLSIMGWSFFWRSSSICFQIKSLLRTNVLNEVTDAMFLVSFSQLPTVKNPTKNSALRTFVCSNDFSGSKITRIRGRSQTTLTSFWFFDHLHWPSLSVIQVDIFGLSTQLFL